MVTQNVQRKLCGVLSDGWILRVGFFLFVCFFKPPKQDLGLPRWC